MPNRLVRVFRQQFLELGLSLFMFEMSCTGAGKNSGWLNAEERWRLAAFDTAPEFTLGGDD